MIKIGRTISAYLPDISEKTLGSFIFDKSREIQRYYAFNDAILANNLPRAYGLFNENPEVLLLYHNNNGKTSTQCVFAEARKQLGFFKSRRMRNSLPRLLRKENKKLKDLTDYCRAVKKETEEQMRKSHSRETMEIRFDY